MESERECNRWWLPGTGAGGWKCVCGEQQGDVGQRVQAFSYKRSKFWESNIQHGD